MHTNFFLSTGVNKYYSKELILNILNLACNIC